MRDVSHLAWLVQRKKTAQKKRIGQGKHVERIVAKVHLYTYMHEPDDGFGARPGEIVVPLETSLLQVPRSRASMGY